MSLPSQAGASSLLFLRIPSKYIYNCSSILLSLPLLLPSITPISLLFSNQSSLNYTYFNALQITYKNHITDLIISSTLSSTINQMSTLNINISAYSTNITTAWTYIIMSKVSNPSYSDPSQLTTIQAIDNSSYLMSNFNGYLPLPILPTADPVHFLHIWSSSTDLVSLTTLNLTYRLDTQLFLNRSSFVISFPKTEYSSFYAIPNISCCITVNYTQLECGQC